MNVPPALTYPAIISAGVPEVEARRIVEAVECILSPPQGPSVRVRIAVAVDRFGSWVANGWKEAPDSIAIRECTSHVRDSIRRIVWIEADVPLPLTPQTIQAVVNEGG